MIMVVLGSSVVACENKAQSDHGGVQEMSPQTVEKALEAHTDELMSLSGVVGTAQSLCEGQPCIKVFVVENTPDLERAIHAILAGVPVAIEETGKVRARPEKPDSR